MRPAHFTCLFLPFLGSTHAGNFNYATCKSEVLNGTFGFDGTVDRNGQPLKTENFSLVEGYMYPFCLQNCGSGAQFTDYNDFWNQATLWFLPWFLLVSQIPCFTKDKLNDCLVMILSVGSPTTALYSLFLTSLDERWLKVSCNAVRKADPREEVDKMLKHISQVLNSLHQFPLEVEEVGLVACTLALEQNRYWWRKLGKWFVGRQRRMEASAYAQLVLVIVLYGLAVLPEAFMLLGGIFLGNVLSNCKILPPLTVSPLGIYGSGSWLLSGVGIVLALTTLAEKQ